MDVLAHGSVNMDIGQVISAAHYVDASTIAAPDVAGLVNPADVPPPLNRQNSVILIADYFMVMFPMISFHVH
eukprot:1301917-Karenia_brevis.AAC.1